MTWQEERESDFAAMQSEWGVTVERNGLSAIGIKTPDIVDRTMQPANYLSDVRSSFDLLRTDFQRLGLGTRVQFRCGSVSYEIVRLRDDAADVTVAFDSVRLK